MLLTQLEIAIIIIGLCYNVYKLKIIAVFLLSAQPYLREMNSSQVLNKVTIINGKNEKYVWGDKGF